MSRTLSSGVVLNLEQDVIYPFFAVELLFDDGTFETVDGDTTDRILRLWTGFGTLIFDGNEYFGTGNLLEVSTIEETAEMSAKGATLTLSGVPSEVISLALSEAYQGRQAKLHFGLLQKGKLLLESSNYILLQDGGKIFLEDNKTSLTEVFVGYMDQMNINESADSATIELTIENRLVDLERARVGRFTSEYQKSIYPTDKGFDFVESMQDLKLNWGRTVD